MDFDWYSSGINLEANWYLMPIETGDVERREVKESNARLTRPEAAGRHGIEQEGTDGRSGQRKLHAGVEPA